MTILLKSSFWTKQKATATEQFNERKEIFEEKKKELDNIVSETEKRRKSQLLKKVWASGKRLLTIDFYQHTKEFVKTPEMD